MGKFWSGYHRSKKATLAAFAAGFKDLTTEEFGWSTAEPAADLETQVDAWVKKLISDKVDFLSATALGFEYPQRTFEYLPQLQSNINAQGVCGSLKNK